MYNLLNRMYPDILIAHSCLYFLVNKGFVLLCNITDLACSDIDDELKTRIQQQIESDIPSKIAHNSKGPPVLDVDVFVNLIIGNDFTIIAIRVSDVIDGYFDKSTAECKTLLDKDTAMHISLLPSDAISVANRLLGIANYKPEGIDYITKNIFTSYYCIENTTHDAVEFVLRAKNGPWVSVLDDYDDKGVYHFYGVLISNIPNHEFHDRVMKSLYDVLEKRETPSPPTIEVLEMFNRNGVRPAVINASRSGKISTINILYNTNATIDIGYWYTDYDIVALGDLWIAHIQTRYKLEITVEIFSSHSEVAAGWYNAYMDKHNKAVNEYKVAFINFHSNHWICVVYTGKFVYLMDSGGGTGINIHKDFFKPRDINVITPRYLQTNGCDCGMLAIRNAFDLILTGQATKSEKLDNNLSRMFRTSDAHWLGSTLETRDHYRRYMNWQIKIHDYDYKNTHKYTHI